MKRTARDLQDTNKQPIYRSLKRREKEKSAESLFEEIMAKNDQNLRKKVCIKFQKSQQIPTRKNLKKPTLGHIMIKSL